VLAGSFGVDTNASLLRELAHELRDVLSPVRSAIELMRLRNFDAQVTRTMVERIETGLDSALSTIDAFVLAEAWERGRESLEPARIPLPDLLQRLRESLKPPLSERVKFAADSPFPVTADAFRSTQVLVAMLGHAAAVASPASPIELRSAASDGGAEVRVTFAIEAQACVAESWFETYRVRGSAGRMALRTARQIMQRQQGNLSVVVPAPGRCELVATFAAAAAVSTPDTRAGRTAASAARSSARPREPAPPHTTRVLIVEDSAEVSRAYREALAELGYPVIESRNAEEALRAVDEAMPDVAIIDIHLPGMNGYQLAQALRARGGAALRLVMLSGMTLDDTLLQLSKRAGFDECFDKAAGPKALHSLLRGLL
jgi:CheY-like chemotaxis protein